MFVPAKQSVDDDDDDDDGCWEHRVDVSHARISAGVRNTVRQSFMGIPNAMNNISAKTQRPNLFHQRPRMKI